MEFKALTPNLMVKDVNKTVDFYKNILGFELVMSVPETGIYNWAMMKRGNTEIMFQEQKNLISEYKELAGKEIGATFALFFKVSNIQDFYNQIKEKTALIVELHRTFYDADEFAIQDLNGYILTFAEM